MGGFCLGALEVDLPRRLRGAWCVSRWREPSRPTWLSQKIQDWHWDGMGCLKRAKGDSGKGGLFSLFGRAIGHAQKVAASLVQIVFQNRAWLEIVGGKAQCSISWSGQRDPRSPTTHPLCLSCSEKSGAFLKKIRIKKKNLTGNHCVVHTPFFRT